jgi:translation initiation factor 3 subunit L|eukprot:TRINITY_DN1082_c0_g1_i1.p1 TRINITY_DN1082_c0_g1~~TRINITY_DN1082_c0_g1_i1.p1  ORF type:complete len:549 (-),score=86.77 TRINITY_DN1082_c0_g1_i1:92-1666(-)
MTERTSVAAPPTDSSESESEEQERPKSEVIPDSVDHFLGKLYEYIQVRNIPEIHSLYDDMFQKLTDKYYKSTKWPRTDSVAQALSIDDPESSLFIILYKDLYYRHIYTKFPNQLTYEDRQNGWENYCKLLELFIDDLQGEDKCLSAGLPTQWIWDILDEFVYHFQVYCAHRNKTVKVQKEAEIQKFRDNPDVFETSRVLSLLHQIVEGSLIDEWMKAPHNPENKKGAFTDEMVRYMGYFALMQLLRMHSLLGDYRLALHTIENLDFHAEVPLFYKVPACHITLYYYMGFAYLMMRRTHDAIRTFARILVFLSKSTGASSLSGQYEICMKKQEQMYSLLMICLSLCPTTLDDFLEKALKSDRHAEKMAKLHAGEESDFEDLFAYACPKFISPAPPDYDNLDSFNQNEAHNRQVKLFLQEVRQQQALPKIGSYMKLYTSLKASKFAQLCEMDEEGLRDQLLSVMHKTRQLVHKEGPPCQGEVRFCSEVEFYLDGDMIHISSYKHVRPHADVFLEQILRFQELLKKI